MSKVGLVRYKIIALRLMPKALKSRIVDENVPSAGSIGSIFKVEIASVQCQGFAVDIERDRRKSPVVVFRDQFTIWDLKKRLGYWPRRQEGIEYHQGQPSGVVKQNHHQRRCQECAQIHPFVSRQSATEQSDRCARERKAQISKGVEGKVQHVAQREAIDARMVAKRGRDVTRSGDVVYQEKNGDSRERCAAGNNRKRASAETDPITALGHGRPEQQSHRRIAGHRVIFLRRREREKHQDKSDPANRQQTCAARTVDGLERKLCDRWEIDAPREKPQKVKEPKPQPRHGIVITGIAQIEEAENLLVDEIEPQEAVVLPWAAMQRKRKVRGISNGSQDVPRRGNRQRDEESADGT